MIAQILVAIATSSKAFSKIFEEATTLYYSLKLQHDQNQSIEVAEEREKLLSDLQRQGLTDEEKRKIRKRLIDLSSL